MPSDPASSFLFAAAAAIFFLAGLVKGVTGMGLPTVAMGLLGALVSPLTAAGLLIVPSFVTNLWQLLAGGGIRSLARRFWPMMLAILVGTLLGSAWLAAGDSRLSGAGLGVALAAYAGVSLSAGQPRISRQSEAWLSPLVGLATGLVTGGTGVFVIPAVPYIQALGLARDELVQALGLSFTVSTVALAAGLGAHGAFQPDRLLYSALAVLPALAGMWSGQIIRRHISPPVFRRLFLYCLLLLGMEMVGRALW